jgi:hypothetical protein
LRLIKTNFFRAVQALRENLAELRNTSEPVHYHLSLKKFPEEDFTRLLESEGGKRRNLWLTYYHGLDFARLRIPGFGITFRGDFSLESAKVRRTSLNVSKKANEGYMPGPSITPWLSWFYKSDTVKPCCSIDTTTKFGGKARMV